MSRPLTDRERQIRMNIRNCYLVATQEELENEIEYRLGREDFMAVRFLQELKDEIQAENQYVESVEIRTHHSDNFTVLEIHGPRLICSNFRM